MVELVQHHALRVSFHQQRLAEGMKRRQGHRFAALTGGLHYASFHLTGGFLRERQAENIFAGKCVIRLQKMPDAFGNDACFSGARPGNNQQWSLAVGDGALLRFVELQAALTERLHLKQRGHYSRRVSDFSWQGKRALALRKLAGSYPAVELA